MKLNIRTFALAGLLAFSTAALAQNNPPADTPANSAQPAITNAPAEGATLAAADTALATPAPAEEAAPATTVPETAVQGDASAIIPLIVMDEVPLSDAIKNLARQANLNYMLDPKMNLAASQDGRPGAQPLVSLRWMNVTAGQALQALLSNYNLQIVEDPKSKIARVTVRDPEAPDPLVTRVIQLDYANPTNIMSAVQSALTDKDKRSKVVADLRTSQIVFLGTEKELAAVESLIKRLDTPNKQVLIEAKLLETSMNPQTRKGMDWSGTLQNQNLKMGNNLKQNTPSDSLNNTLVSGAGIPKFLLDTSRGLNPGTAFLDADGVSAVLSFLNQYSEAKVISSPRTVTLDNEPARIEVTRASPIINVTPGTVQVSGGSQIQYTNLGIILNVTPRISANNQVNLKVVPEVSRVFATVTKLVADGVYQADEYDIRRMETRVVVPSGNTLVLGGLIQDDVRRSNTKVPLLGDIPVLGGAFRHDSKSRQKSNLIVFITPTIVQETDFQPTKSDFLKTPAPAKDEVEGDWSSWDSGKPRDWKKKQAKETQTETVEPAKFSELPSEPTGLQMAETNVEAK